jgi:hypothetical protein
MITLRLPSGHPNAPVVQRWASDKEAILTNHTNDIEKMKGLLQTILTNSPELGKAK